MSFDAMSKEIASTLSGVFGDPVLFERPNEHSSEITAVIRRDVETVDESGQVAIVAWMVRFAHSDVPFTPKRDDLVTRTNPETNEVLCLKLGSRLSDNRSAMEFEAQVAH